MMPLIRVNTSDYGDSRITQPTKTEKKDILRTKGGANAAVLVGKIAVSYTHLTKMYLSELVSDGAVVAEESSRARKYRLKS